jgi:hypothetical protein
VALGYAQEQRAVVLAHPQVMSSFIIFVLLQATWSFGIEAMLSHGASGIHR